MSEAAALSPPPEGSREDIIKYYRGLAATPHTEPNCAELRRMGLDGLTLVGAPPAASSFGRRRRWLVSTHFRAARPSGPRKRI